jgi:arginine:pyruvate transaminase
MRAPDPSRRVRGILEGGSDGWELLSRARALKAQGAPVVNLTIGEHDAPTPTMILDAMDRSARGGNTGYAPLTGTPGLRAAIAARASRTTGAPVGPEEVIVCAGGQAALLHAMLACIDPGDRVAIVDPYYATYPGTVRAAGGVVVATPAPAATGFQIDLDAFDRAAEGARAALVNTPHNPTGAVYTRATLEGIAEIVNARGLWLISDEVYEGMVYAGEHLSPRGLPGMAERAIVIGSMSKSHAMTGFRLGWAVGPERLIRLMADISLNAAYGLPGFIQDAAEHALRHGAAEEAEISATFGRRRHVVLEALAGARSVRAGGSDGAMYVMADVRGTGLSGKEFAERLLEAELIAVMPGESFGAASAGHVRIALTVPDEALADAMRRLARFADALEAAPAGAAAAR